MRRNETAQEYVAVATVAEKGLACPYCGGPMGERQPGLCGCSYCGQKVAVKEVAGMPFLRVDEIELEVILKDLKSFTHHRSERFFDLWVGVFISDCRGEGGWEDHGKLYLQAALKAVRIALKKLNENKDDPIVDVLETMKLTEICSDNYEDGETQLVGHTQGLAMVMELWTMAEGDVEAFKDKLVWLRQTLAGGKKV